jgi:hypothetical protein
MTLSRRWIGRCTKLVNESTVFGAFLASSGEFALSDLFGSALALYLKTVRIEGGLGKSQPNEVGLRKAVFT